MLRTGLLLALAVGCGATSTAQAGCAVVGDSVGVGLGLALRGVCSTSAQVGIGSSAVASRVMADGRWAIVSLGSNDFPRGISPAQRVRSEARVRGALSMVAAKAGRRLILVLPANGARGPVESWAAANAVPTVRFAAGPDGIHPRSYGALAQEVRGRIGD